MTRRRLIVPGLSTAVMLAILLCLGTWQLQRLAWKTAFLARIDAAEQAPGVPLTATPPAPYTKVRVQGVFRGELAAVYGAEVRDTAAGSRLGAQLLTPLARDGAAPVLIDRGWIDVALPLPPPPAGLATIEGYARPADRAHWFSASDNPAARRFFTLDPAAIGTALGTTLEPFVIVALGPAQIPDPARALPRPPNDHLQYALTWFGFAATLVVIFALYSRKVLRP